MAQAFKKSDIEILLSTMNRDSLDFLTPMFPFTHFTEFKILIINQTTQENILQSPYVNIRVINSFEKGLSKSRNLALANAGGKIALMTDDDVIFKEGFDETIYTAFNAFPDAALIKFCAAAFEGKLFRKYTRHAVKNMNAMQRLNTMSIEIALNVERVKQSGIIFNALFGLGSFFSMGEEPIFVNDLHKAGFQVSFVPKTIVTHKSVKDSDNIAISEVYRIRGAYLKKIFDKQFFLWVGIQLMYHLKGRVITPFQIPFCIKNALKGRKQLLNLTEK
ncbi:glycosyltransferase family 2 protein [Flavobacterium rhizosphaerae]|uniref:Glycosyltransferase family A protein n=1 Tax=Flavobacterium rhizosphaerae TaxID=3163298 RepID=A0ABW8YZN7_9FLAO